MVVKDEENGNRIYKERYRKFKDDWRYVGCDVWRLDKVSGYYSPEDDWIDSIDNKNIITFPPQIAMVDWIAEVLEERESKILYDYVWLGKSMDEIGEEMGYTRQRIWQLYKQGLERIGGIVGDEEQFKAMFIMEQSEDDEDCRENKDKDCWKKKYVDTSSKCRDKEQPHLAAPNEVDEETEEIELFNSVNNS